jgi:hypothetical protein
MPGKTLTSIQALAFVEHPAIQFTEVARRFYADGKPYARQRLRRRLYQVASISEDTLVRLTEVRDRLVREIAG